MEGTTKPRSYEEMIDEIQERELPPQIKHAAISLLHIAQQSATKRTLEEIIQEAYLVEKFFISRSGGKQEVVSSEEVRALMHDINNVTMVVSGMISIVRQGLIDGTNTPDLIEDLNIAQDGVDKLSSLVEATQKLTHKEQLRLEKINIGELVASTADLVRRSFLKQRQMETVVCIEVDCDDDLTAYVDEVDINRAIGNILRNAVEAMYPNGGLITVKAFKASQGEEIIISISDTGKGIPQDNIKKIFKSGYSSKKQPGHGLGMTNVFRTISRNNGSISVTSRTEEDSPDGSSGTNITVRLPKFTSVDKLDKKALRRICLVQVGGNDIKDEMKKHVTIYLHLNSYPEVIAGLRHIPQESIVVIHDEELEDKVLDGLINPQKLAQSLSKDRPDLTLVFAKSQEGITPSRRESFSGVLEHGHNIDDLTNLIVQIRSQKGLTDAIKNI